MKRTLVAVLAVFLGTTLTMCAADAEPLRLTHTIPLPGVKGRFDHFACEAVAHRLAVAALGNNTAEIFDIAKVERVHTIPALRKPTGALMLPEVHRVYFANGDDGTFRAFDAASY